MTDRKGAIEAEAFWVEEPGRGALRTEEIRDRGPGEVLVRTLYTGISRGTEALVFRGEVPPSEHERMRAPFQGGDFPGPVKYGYLNVGVVEHGPPELEGRTVFTLFPHQSRFVIPASAVTLVPEGVPARRAVLAGAVETAVNVLWDAAPLVGDRVSVIGGGLIGTNVALLLAGIPGIDLVVVDGDHAKADLCRSLDIRYAPPEAAPTDRDLVIETSGSGEGLQLALACAAFEGEIVVASWFGDRSVSLPLGGAFHSRRLTIRSSQVGAVSPRRSGRRTTTDRLSLALGMLVDPRFDAVLTGSSPWRDLPTVMSAIAAGTAPGLCHTIDWSDA
ncbi:zinc-dependent alcohol dehydrogenase [Microbacterium rhizomatis]|uniref:Zinc-binding alcohol dehydrogenase n=1 Tax=Microbacterium rhizomatis TaxID=1631477 RepID=A0A5J5J323_9MICO|nr:zinc-binding alcohol dehydrogenase [Microbacterium rhizomatis]KAA9107810.1 zinc-binding alcohol dehydrogenase [Microbacterium rhizomatis]